MTCIHGFDEINCPTCRMVKISIPGNQDKIEDLYNNDLKPYNSLIEGNNRKKEYILTNLTPHGVPFKRDLIKSIREEPLLNKIPDFQNRMFSERLDELKLEKSEL